MWRQGTRCTEIRQKRVAALLLLLMMMTMHVGCCTDELSMLSLAEAAYSTAILFNLPCNFSRFSPVPTLSEAALATVTVPFTSKWDIAS